MRRRRVRVPRPGETWGNTDGALVRVFSVEYRQGWGDVVFFVYPDLARDDDRRCGADQVALFLRDYWGPVPDLRRELEDG